MGKLGFIRLSDGSVKKIKKYLKGFYNQKVLNLCDHDHVIREVYGDGLSEETKIYNELVLWLRYFEALISHRPAHMDLLSKVRTDYNTLFSFIRTKHDLSAFIGLTDIDIVGGAVYEEEYVPKLDVFLQGLHDLARCVALKQGNRRNDQMGFINMRPEEVNRLMRNVKEAANNMISYTLLEVRDVLNNDPFILALNRLVYLCRVVYAMSRSWKDLQEMCVDRINLLRRRLASAFYERPVFARVYVRNALEKAVDHISAYTLLRRVEDDFLLFKNALKWGDPNWGIDSGTESSDDSESESENENKFSPSHGAEDGEIIKTGEDTNGIKAATKDITKNVTSVCEDEECKREDEEFEKYLGVTMVNGRPMRWWTPTGIKPTTNEGALWVNEYGDRVTNPFDKHVRSKSTKSKQKIVKESIDEDMLRRQAEEAEHQKMLEHMRFMENERRKMAESAELKESSKNKREEPKESSKSKREESSGSRRQSHDTYNVNVENYNDNDDGDEEKILFEETSDIFEDALSSPRSKSPHDMWTKDHSIPRSHKDNDSAFVTKDGRVYLPFPTNINVSSFSKETSKSGNHSDSESTFPLLSYVDDKYFKPHRSENATASGKIRVRHSSAKQPRSERKFEKNKIYGSRPSKTDDEYYWDNTGSPIEGEKPFERLHKSDDELHKLNLGIKGLKLDDSKNMDSIQIEPPKPRQFADSPFVMLDEHQPSDSSGFTVLTQGTNDADS